MFSERRSQQWKQAVLIEDDGSDTHRLDRVQGRSRLGPGREARAKRRPCHDGLKSGVRAVDRCNIFRKVTAGRLHRKV